MSAPTQTSTLVLAYVDDATNVGARVRLQGEAAARPAQYSTAIQQHGVVIRAGHMVVVDTSLDSLEIVWRIGTRGTIEAIAAPNVTLNFGYRPITMPIDDRRPDNERQAHPLASGETVLLQGSPLEQSAIIDLVVNGELAHPDRLHAQLERIAARLTTSNP